MQVDSKLIFPIFLSDYRIVEEKKRYDKLNDAAYSALKCRDCAANVFFNFPSYSSFLDGFPFHVPFIVSPFSPSFVPLSRFVPPSRFAIVVPPYSPPCLPPHLSDANLSASCLPTFASHSQGVSPLATSRLIAPSLLADGRGEAIVRAAAMAVRIVIM